MVQPQNHPDSVKEFIDFLGIDGNQVFRLFPNDPDNKLPPTFPKYCTVENLVTNYLDINGLPKRCVVWNLKACVKNL